MSDLTEDRLTQRREASRRYREANKEKVREANLRWYHANKHTPEFAEKRRAWQRAHPDRTLAATLKWQRANPEKTQAIKLRYRANNPEKIKLKRRQYGLHTYGIIPEQYAKMLASQQGLCAICKRLPRSGRQLAVDHCHKTKQIRGLLCNNCNNGLGRFKDNPELLYEAAAYLERT